MYPGAAMSSSVVVSNTRQTDSNIHDAAAPIAWASQSKGAAMSDAVPSPTASHTAAMTGTSQTLIRKPSQRVWPTQTDWPTLQKKLTSVTAAPQMMAAPHETRTPSFPREARCGLEEFAPKPHTIAATISARTLRMRPTVMTAPTIVRNCSMPGSPVPLGVMSITVLLPRCKWADVSEERQGSPSIAIEVTPVVTRGLQRRADTDEEIEPCHAGAGGHRGCDADREPDPRPARRLVLTVR